MPWSNQSGNNGGWQSGGRGKGPWGQGSQGPGRQPPDLEEILKKGQDRIKNIIPGGRSNRLIWVIIALVIVGGWLYRSVYVVQPDQVGIELVLGQAKDEFNGPGVHFHFWPFESVETPKVLEENQENIGFARGASRGSSSESLMLAGDQNIVDIDFTVLWKIREPRAFLFNVRDQSTLVRVVAESAMRDHLGSTPAEVIRTTGRDDAQDVVRVAIQKTLDSYDAGMNIVAVKIEKADPPPAVNDAFEEVQRAKQDQDKFIEEAQKYSNRKLGQARGEAAKIREEAEAYKGRVVAEAEGEAKRFVSVFEEYQKAKGVTRKRLFLETLEGVLSGSNKIIIEGEAGQGVVPYLPLPEVAKRRGQTGASNTGGQ